MKCKFFAFFPKATASLPVRGAWIEIEEAKADIDKLLSRSPCGERGLKLNGVASVASLSGRSPCGERGLKCRKARNGSF